MKPNKTSGSNKLSNTPACAPTTQTRRRRMQAELGSPPAPLGVTVLHHNVLSTVPPPGGWCCAPQRVLEERRRAHILEWGPHRGSTGSQRITTPAIWELLESRNN